MMNLFFNQQQSERFGQMIEKCRMALLGKPFLPLPFYWALIPANREAGFHKNDNKTMQQHNLYCREQQPGEKY